jgi:RNA polymerase sigma-70 factor (ECF subfamily)
VTNHDEKAIIEEILSGNKDLYRILVNKHKDFAFKVAFSVVNNTLDAEEVACDGFMKAYKNLSGFKHDAKFSTWLYRIVYFTAISFTRKKQVKKESVKSIQHLADERTDKLEGDDRSRYIQEALISLEENDRQVLQLFYLKEFSLEEISEITGTSVNTIKVRLHRARKKMADMLTKMLDHEALYL